MAANRILVPAVANRCLSCPDFGVRSFYNSVGEVNVDTVKTILADNKQVKPQAGGTFEELCFPALTELFCSSHLKESVIGWYRQRRNTDQQMTFREKMVHEKLRSALSNPHMIFVLLTPSKLTPPGSTHRMEYAAFISRSRSLKPLHASYDRHAFCLSRHVGGQR